MNIHEMVQTLVLIEWRIPSLEIEDLLLLQSHVDQLNEMLLRELRLKKLNESFY